MTRKRSTSWPVLKTYRGEKLENIRMPIGGIGTGTISLGGRGPLRDWQIANRPARGACPPLTFLAVRAKAPGAEPVARLLEGPVERAMTDGEMGIQAPLEGLPRFRRCEFTGAYPLGQVRLSDPQFPLGARIEAFNPMIPADADDSGIPVAVVRIVLRNPTDRRIAASVCASMGNFIGTDGTFNFAAGNTNHFRRSDDGKLAGIFMSSDGVDEHLPQYGTLALTTTATRGVSSVEAWGPGQWNRGLVSFWDSFVRTGRVDRSDADRWADPNQPTAALGVSVQVAPKSERAVTLLITWRYPNRYGWNEQAARGGKPPRCRKSDNCGNYYATRYRDAWDVAEKVAPRLGELEDRTVEFVRSFVDSDLPEEVRDAALCNVSTLRSTTVFRTADGYLWGWEGSCDRRGGGQGSCTHVWNYELATPLLYGELAAGMREVEFVHGTDENGLMSFRLTLPTRKASSNKVAAADGQMGCIMKLYREWQLSGDDDLLRRCWDAARRAMEFCWLPGCWDADADGVMEGCQHNTMDIEYYGPNPQMQGWYLGALRAVEEMARYLGEDDFAARCRELFEAGSKWADEHLFNGEYYEQEIRPPAGKYVKGTLLGVPHPNDPTLAQLGRGCLVDQLVGQYMAHLCELGYLLDRAHVRKALRSIKRYNFRRNFWGHFNPRRAFSAPDEAGTLMATWPHGGRPAMPFPYFGETMTGFEYTAAVGMIQEGQTAAGLELIRAVRDRHDGTRRNPFDEPEFGRHYARAMASWAAVAALTEFHYSAVTGELTFAAASERVRWFFSTGWAWGVFTQRPSGRCDVEILGGELTLRRFALRDGRTKQFDPPRTLTAGDRLRIELGQALP